ncbi:GNAT family N-acetyltransferase [Streptomyces sp. NPDC046727]|uniref:GNAT family N-acetyltransferase n=1 Tax=Streptomyces sp. NPDC046727 TaxID=3155373 RepID=UPI0033EABDDF
MTASGAPTPASGVPAPSSGVPVPAPDKSVAALAEPVPVHGVPPLASGVPVAESGAMPAPDRPVVALDKPVPARVVPLLPSDVRAARPGEDVPTSASGMPANEAGVPVPAPGKAVPAPAVPLAPFGIQAARPGDLEQVEALWMEARRWLAGRGLDQWQYPPRRWRWVEAIEAGDCHLVLRAGRPVATITVDERADPEWWSADDPSSALYVHDLAVSRAVAGQALGARLLDWASALAARRGKRWLRLDAWKTNGPLHRYYLEQGFALLRIVDLPHRNSGALFQRPATAPPPEREESRR